MGILLVVVRRWSMRRWLGKISMVKGDLKVVTVQLEMLQKQGDPFSVVSDRKCNEIKSSQTVTIITVS